MLATRFSKRRSRIVAAATTFAMCGALAISPVMAATADEPIDTSGIEVMGSYPAADFVAEAQALPPELVTSLDVDLGITGEEFMAQSEAAAQAVEVVDSLEDAGIVVLGSRIDGTTLTVNVSTEAEVAVVEAAGAVGVVGEPAPFVAPEAPLVFAADPSSDFYGGQGYYFESGVSAFRCTSGFNGFSSTGGRQFLSAGHCVKNAQSPVTALNMSSPNQEATLAQLGPILGEAVLSSAKLGDGNDAGLVNVSNPNVRSQSSVLTWGGSAGVPGAGAPLASTPLTITGTSRTVDGAAVCKSGSSTGWKCGTVLAVDITADVDGSLVNSVVTDACTVQGDSGGPLVSGSLAIGVTSWATIGTCDDPNFASGAFPMAGGAGKSSVAALYGANWEIAVAVAAPAVTTASGAHLSGIGSITGTVSSPTPSSKVLAYLDGATSPFATVPATSGSWSISLNGVAAGSHSVSLAAGSGWSRSAPVVLSVVVDNISQRISGTDRFDTAIKVSTSSYPAGSPTSINVVYVTTGRNFPDALSAAPAAARQGGVLLLTEPNSLPANVRDEIIRLDPAKIVVVGGPNSVSDSVFASLESVQPNIIRIGGGDRYETSRNIVKYAFPSAASAYVATGANFPDALSASGAGGALDTPVILVPGHLSSVDSATQALLTALGVSNIAVIGGPASMTEGMKASLGRIAPTTRIGGEDRFETSKNIAVAAFGSSNPTEVFLATGYNFPDALAGAVLAGTRSAPLIVIPTSCIPASVIAALQQFGTTKVTLLGGAAVLTEDVARLKQC
ncbi:cell wall-binding repeat-containing protein [Salinibacterium xinjiangense]|nr:cell wall-binding repeat-containing protein [Salinibacterium xinjiangense]